MKQHKWVENSWFHGTHHLLHLAFDANDVVEVSFVRSYVQGGVSFVVGLFAEELDRALVLFGKPFDGVPALADDEPNGVERDHNPFGVENARSL